MPEARTPEAELPDDVPAGTSPGPLRPSAGDLAMLERQVLDAGLGGFSLPGLTQSVRLGDLALLQDGDGTVLLDPMGAEDVSLDGLAVPVRRQSPKETDRPYLRLRSDVAASGEVIVSLDAVLPSREGSRPLGLGTLVVRFTRDGDGWRLTGPPAQLGS